MKNFYFVLAFLGLAVPYLLPELFEFEISASWLDQLFTNRVGTFIALDLLISAITAITFMVYQGRKIKMKFYWVPVACTIAVGLSFGLPLYLYLREGHLDVK